jgi:hypothetical protein
MMAGTQSFLRASGHWTSAYMPQQGNLGGEAGKVVLTMEEDGVDGEIVL